MRSSRCGVGLEVPEFLGGGVAGPAGLGVADLAAVGGGGGDLRAIRAGLARDVDGLVEAGLLGSGSARRSTGLPSGPVTLMVTAALSSGRVGGVAHADGRARELPSGVVGPRWRRRRRISTRWGTSATSQRTVCRQAFPGRLGVIRGRRSAHRQRSPMSSARDAALAEALLDQRGDGLAAGLGRRRGRGPSRRA